MLITVESLNHTFPGKPPRAALQDLCFEVPPGQFAAIVGPSGCGKSTFLRLAAGLLAPTRGRLLLDGQPPARAARQRRSAWMAQSPALLPWLSVSANAGLALRYHRTDLPARLSAEDALRLVNLHDSARAFPFSLSGGMQQRLALARTLTLDADLWLMDEPFSALDELTREQLTAELFELWQPRRPTVLWVTHNLHEAIRLADRILVLSPVPGHLVADFNVDLARPRREDAASFQSLLAGLRRALGMAVAQPEAQ